MTGHPDASNGVRLRAVEVRALAQFLTEMPDRPLYAHVAAHNIGSIRVLQKCGFHRDHGQEAPASRAEGETEEFLFVRTE